MDINLKLTTIFRRRESFAKLQKNYDTPLLSYKFLINIKKSHLSLYFSTHKLLPALSPTYIPADPA